jgi:C-terminal processing protease CtpA/Prc
MYRFRILLIVLLLAVAGLVSAQDSAVPQAVIQNDEGGPVIIRGSVSYTNAFFTGGVSEPMVILEDQTGFITRNLGYLLPPESQVLGQITSDFFTSPFSYTVGLPIEPQAPLNDLDHDDADDAGVMVFQVAYWSNTFGDAFLEERDLYGGGWSTAYASARVSPDFDTQGEYIGGKIVIYAVGEGYEFPSGFGADQMLFTDDDPLVIVPQGYTIVDMDSDPFTFDRTREPVIDLIEGEGAEADDFSALTYTEAFDALIDKFRREYAFSEFYNLDWDAISAEFRPLFEDAEFRRDQESYERALQQVVWSIPDGHVGMTFTETLVNDFQTKTAGGLGIAVRELDDGRVIVNFLLPDGPADEAGIQLRAEIRSINGTPILEAIEQAQPFSAPFSTSHFRRLQQMRYVTRFEAGSEVTVTYVNPGETTEQTATMTVSDERSSFAFSSFNVSRSGFELPVMYETVGEGLLYVEISSFFDDDRLTILLWERMLTAVQENEITGIIIDMRNNGGGSGFLADQMAAYFFDEPIQLGNAGFYDEERGEFYFDPNQRDRFFLAPEQLRFDGPIAVLVGPNCLSACEFFSYDMTLQDRATIVGQYPTGGLGGSVNQFYMPENISVQITIGRAVDADGNIHIEGQGVAPDVLVPVNEETLFSDGDPVLQAAIDFLSNQ